MDSETTLGRFTEADFQPEKHLGMWVQLSPDDMVAFKEDLEGVDSDGFHLVNRALILDIPVEDARSKEWESKVKPITDELHKIAKMMSLKGEVRITTALIGSRQGPMVGEFFSIKPGGETDTVLMLTFVNLADGFLPSTLRRVPVLASEDSSFAPKFIGDVVSG